MLNVPEAILFASARGAISAAFATAIPSESVILPAYTCVAVVNAALTAGCRIIWTDVDAVGCPVYDDFGDHGFLAQDTYGFPSTTNASALTIRDASHRADLLRGPCPAAITITSFEHSKWISAGRGGLAVTTDPGIAQRMRSLRDSSSDMDGTIKNVAFTTCGLIAGRLLYSGWRVPGQIMLLVMGRLHADRARGQSLGEMSGRGVDLKLLGRPDGFTTRLMIEQVRRIDEIATHRARIVGLYDAAFGLTRPTLPLVRYPLAVQDRDAADVAFQQRGWSLGRPWFNAPLHPSGADAAAFGLTSAPPMAQELADTVINLPTHPLVSTQDAHTLAKIAHQSGAVPLHRTQY